MADDVLDSINFTYSLWVYEVHQLINTTIEQEVLDVIFRVGITLPILYLR